MASQHRDLLTGEAINHFRSLNKRERQATLKEFLQPRLAEKFYSAAADHISCSTEKHSNPANP